MEWHGIESNKCCRAAHILNGLPLKLENAETSNTMAYLQEIPISKG